MNAKDRYTIECLSTRKMRIRAERFVHYGACLMAVIERTERRGRGFWYENQHNLQKEFAETRAELDKQLRESVLGAGS